MFEFNSGMGIIIKLEIIIARAFLRSVGAIKTSFNNSLQQQTHKVEDTFFMF